MKPLPRAGGSHPAPHFRFIISPQFAASGGLSAGMETLTPGSRFPRSHTKQPPPHGGDRPPTPHASNRSNTQRSVQKSKLSPGIASITGLRAVRLDSYLSSRPCTCASAPMSSAIAPLTCSLAMLLTATQIGSQQPIKPRFAHQIAEVAVDAGNSRAAALNSPEPSAPLPPQRGFCTSPSYICRPGRSGPTHEPMTIHRTDWAEP